VTAHTRRSSCRVLFAALVVVLAFAGCASAPEPTSPSVSCDLLSRTEASYIGATRDSSPFLPPSRLLHSTDEFVVVRIRLALPEPTQVTIDGSAKDESGTVVAPLQTYQQMVDYWNDPTDQLPQRVIIARSDTLQRWYPPGPSFEGKKGRTEYVVIFKGKSPIPRPATVTLSVALGDAAPQEFSFPLPPKEKGILGLGS
jgi:hypothetical protein